MFFHQFLRFWHTADCDLHHRSMWGASFCKEHDAYVIELVVALWNRRLHESFSGSFLLSEAIICIILALNYTQEPSIKHFDVLKKADSEAVSSSSKSKLLRRLQWSCDHCYYSLLQPILPVCGPSRIYFSDGVCGDSISTADSEAEVGSLQNFETLKVLPPRRKLKCHFKTANFGASKHCNDFLIGCGKRWVRLFRSLFCSK